MPTMTLTAEQAWLGRTRPLAWVEFRHKDPLGDDHTYHWANTDIADPTQFRERRVADFGAISQALSDDRGRLEASTYTFSLTDTDRAIRSFLGTEEQVALLSVEVVVRIQTQADRVAGNDPRVVFRGIVQGYSTRPGFLFDFECVDWLTALQTRKVALPSVRSAFSGAPSSTAARYGPLWYGELSDEPSATAAPTYNANAARGFIDSGGWIGGYGDKGGTPPSNVVLTEDALAGDLPNGFTTYVGVTSIVGGAESDPHEFLQADWDTLTTTGADAAFTVSWDPVTGATAYRVYVGVLYSGTVRVLYYMETASTSVQITAVPDFPTELADASNCTPGALFGSSQLSQYVVTALMADGETLAADTVTGTWEQLQRSFYLRWNTVASALNYYVYKFHAGAWSLRRTVAAGTLEFTDTYAAADWDTVDGLPHGEGVVTAFSVGRLPDKFGYLWHAFAIAGSAISEITGVYQNGSRIDDSDVRYAWPGKSNYATYFDDPFYDAPDGSRWTLLYVLTDAEAEAAADGSQPIGVNLVGIEDVGDGSGDPILDKLDQRAHFQDNFGLASTQWAGGAWGSTPTWGDGTLRRDTASYTSTQSDLASALTSTAGAWGVTTPTEIIGVLADLTIDAGIRFAFTKAGQERVLLDRPLVTNPTIALALSTRDIVRKTFDFGDLTDPVHWHNRAAYQYQPAYDANGGVSYAQTGTADDATSQDRYGRVIEPTETSDPYVSLVATRALLQAQETMTRYIARAGIPARPIRARTALHGLMLEPGDVVSFTHPEGASASGWLHRSALVHRLTSTISARSVEIEAHDLYDEVTNELLAGVLMSAMNLGGSRHASCLNDGSDDVPFDWRPVTVNWDLLPSSYELVFDVEVATVAGTVTPTLAETGGTTAVAGGTGTSHNTDTFNRQQLVVTRTTGVKEYWMLPVIGGGAVIGDVRMFGCLRVRKIGSE